MQANSSVIAEASGGWQMLPVDGLILMMKLPAARILCATAGLSPCRVDTRGVG